MPTLNSVQLNLIENFVGLFFGSSKAATLGSDEEKTVSECIDYITGRFGRMKYILGTGLDFAILAQQLSQNDQELKTYRPKFTEDELFKRYQLVTSRGQRQANTLSLSFNGGKDIGIRRIEEQVLELFHGLDRTDYPSAYVYNTGQWQKYTDLLVKIFTLSEVGRLTLVQELISFGLSALPANSFYLRSEKRIRLYEKIVSDFRRGVDGENGGLIFQAIAFGFCAAEMGHLSIVTDKVRTGSSRQKRFGDIDCYYGLGLEISIEVKDFLIDGSNVESQLGGMFSKIKKFDAIGIAFVLDIEPNIEKGVAERGLAVLKQKDLLHMVSYWDWQKQDIAVQGMLHYLSHIEQDVNAVHRLLDFISKIDPHYQALEFLKG